MGADSIIRALRSALGVGNFPLHEPVAESIERRIVNLPSSAGLV